MLIQQQMDLPRDFYIAKPTVCRRSFKLKGLDIVFNIKPHELDDTLFLITTDEGTNEIITKKKAWGHIDSGRWTLQPE